MKRGGELMRLWAIVACASLAISSAIVEEPNLTGEWRLSSATANAGRNDANNETPTKAHTMSGSAFNCGRACRIVHQGVALTIEQAQLGADDSTSPAVTLQLDGEIRTISDPFNRGNSIETAGRWEGDALSVSSTLRGRLFTNQTISLEKNELVVKTSSVVAGWRTTLRYTRVRTSD